MTATDLRARLLTRQRRAVPVPNDPDGTHVRALTIAESLKLREWVTAVPEPDRDAEASAALIVLCACDAAGERILADEDLADVRTWAADLAEPVATAAFKLNGLDKRAREAAQKKSDPTPS